MRRFFSWLFSRKIMVRCAFTLAVLITGIVIAYHVERWRGQKAWNTYRQAAEKRGVKLALKDYLPPPIPDADNYAAIPAVQAYFQADAEGRKAPELMPSYKGIPKATLESRRRGYDTLQEWRDSLIKSGAKFTPTDNPAKDLLAIIRQEAPELQQLRDAASRRGCRFPTAWENGFDAKQPHTPLFMKAARLFALNARAHFGAGDPQGAASEVGHLFRMYEALRTEPALISGLASITALSFALDSIRDGLLERAWTEPELTFLQTKLQSLNPLALLQFALESERALANLELERMVARNFDPYSQSTLSWKLGIRLYPRGWLYFNQVEYNIMIDEHIGFLKPIASRHSDWIPSHSTAKERLRQRIGDSSWSNLKYVLMLEFFPAFESFEGKFKLVHTQVQQTQIACALELHRLAHQSFPEKLDALVPRFLPAIPTDICDGQPLRYRREEKGYTVWSVGINRVDDGGKPEKRNTPWGEQKDWVWTFAPREMVQKP